MIEVKNRYYIQRFFADNLSASDFFKAVHYTSYRGDMSKIPFWYQKDYGHTGHQSLLMDNDAILNMFKSNTRNEVRRAIKEGCQFNKDVEYNSFVDYYNRFANEKGLPLLDVATLRKYNRIVLTESNIILDGHKHVLAMHATLLSAEDKSATLMYSCSPRLEDGVDRKLIGWGNRYLHYMDFILFRNMGAERYEWNGINMNPETPERYSIGKFKLGFGVEPEESLSLRTPLFTIMRFIRFKLLKKF